MDHLYTDIIANGTKGPVADAAYWTNQKGIDGVVNQIGKQAANSATFVYEKIDQNLVDGAVNLSGKASEGLGETTRTIVQRGGSPICRHYVRSHHNTGWLVYCVCLGETDMDFDNNWLLSLMIFFRLRGSCRDGYPESAEDLIKGIALLTTLITAALGAFMLIVFDYGKSADLQFVVDEDWIGL